VERVGKYRKKQGGGRKDGGISRGIFLTKSQREHLRTEEECKNVKSEDRPKLPDCEKAWGASNELGVTVPGGGKGGGKNSFMEKKVWGAVKSKTGSLLEIY